MSGNFGGVVIRTEYGKINFRYGFRIFPNIRILNLGTQRCVGNIPNRIRCKIERIRGAIVKIIRRHCQDKLVNKKIFFSLKLLVRYSYKMSGIIKDTKLNTCTVSGDLQIPTVTTVGNTPLKGKIVVNENNSLAFADGVQWTELLSESDLTVLENDVATLQTDVSDIKNSPIVTFSPAPALPGSAVITAGTNITVVNTPGVVTINSTSSPPPVINRVLLSTADSTIVTGVAYTIPSNAFGACFRAVAAGAGGQGGNEVGVGGTSGSAGAGITQPLMPGDRVTLVNLGSAGNGTAGGGAPAIAGNGGDIQLIVNDSSVVMKGGIGGGNAYLDGSFYGANIASGFPPVGDFADPTVRAGQRFVYGMNGGLGSLGGAAGAPGSGGQQVFLRAAGGSGGLAAVGFGGGGGGGASWMSQGGNGGNGGGLGTEVNGFPGTRGSGGGGGRGGNVVNLPGAGGNGGSGLLEIEYITY